MNVGGGSYLFTHKYKYPDEVARTTGVWFKPGTMNRMDANWYDWDSYGQIHNRSKILLGKEKIVGSLSGVNQVTLKNGADLWSEVQYWVVNTKQEKDRLIQIMKNHKFTKMPDGRKFDDFFKVKGEDTWKW